MFNFFNQIFLRRQAPVKKPPKGSYGLRVSKSTGNLVLVDEDGTETEVGGNLSGASVVGGALAVTGNSIFGGSVGVSGVINAIGNLKVDVVSEFTDDGGVSIEGVGHPGSGNLTVNALSVALGATITEQGGAADPVADAAVLYAVDNGSGKTQLMVVFPTGAAQQLAIEA